MVLPIKIHQNQGLCAECRIQHYLTRVLEQAYRFGEKPVPPAIVHMTLAPDLHDLEPTLTRHGYNVTILSELLNIRQADVRPEGANV